MAADVLGFIKEHGLKPPTLIGHSMFVHRALLSLARDDLDALTGCYAGAQRRP